MNLGGRKDGFSFLGLRWPSQPDDSGAIKESLICSGSRPTRAKNNNPSIGEQHKSTIHSNERIEVEQNIDREEDNEAVSWGGISKEKEENLRRNIADDLNNSLQGSRSQEGILLQETGIKVCFCTDSN